MKTLLSISLIFLCLSPLAFGAEPSPAAKEIFQKAKEECARFEDGEFHATEQAISHHDFTGDGQPEEIVDASQFSCSTSASMWGGSGGTFLWVVVDDKPYEFLANRWKTIDFDGQSVLLLAVHSSECSDTVGPCFRALVWSDGFRTTR